jgi:predicted MFS family arabinose efflux permease
LSIYELGIPLGTMFGAVAGGWIADNLSWRLAFVLVGLPGLLIALLVQLTIQEPPRGYSERKADAPAVPQPTPPLGAVVRVLFGNWGLVHLIAGATLVSLAGYGTNAYAAAYLIRAFDVSYTLVGLVFGIIGGLTAAIGTLLGGWLSDLSGKRNPRWYALVPGIGVAIALPFYVLIFIQPSWEMAAVFLLIPGIFHFTYVGPTFGLVQNAVEPRMRATAAAVMLFIINIVGLGLGPPLCGWLIDTFSTMFFEAKALGDFLTECPGGVGREGAAAGVDQACKASVVLGTRWGILLTLGFFGWGAVHYFLAARALPKTLLDAIRAGHATS